MIDYKFETILDYCNMNCAQHVGIISIKLACFCAPIYLERFDTPGDTRAFLCHRFAHYSYLFVEYVRVTQ